MKLALYLFMALQLVTHSVFANGIKKDPVQFFKLKNKNKTKKYQFNKYENLISGTAAFLIGNIGYMASDSSVLKVTYSGVQTIGIINIGRSIYKIHSPSIENRFESLVTDPKVNSYTKKEVGNHLIEIYAKEERAKRLSLFYSSSILALQYMFNSLVYDSPDQLENTYIFLGGVNSIIAIYSALYKGDYERHYFGNDFDLSPFASVQPNGNTYGLSLTYNF